MAGENAMNMLDAALEWASRGRPVFPCGPDKKPLTSHGFKDASIDPDEIRQMWSKHPDAMIGMPTGKASGVVVLDFDLDEDKGINAVPVFTELRAAGMIPEGTYTAATPRGGFHVHLEAAEEEIRNAAGYDGRRGFDIRGEGGYVIVPPSISRRGTYIAEDGEAKPEPMPAELVSFLTTPRAKPKSTTSLSQIAEGNRNDSVFRRASALRGKGLEAEELLGAISAFNETKCSPPLGEVEVQGIVRRVALEYPPNDVPSTQATLAEAWNPIPIGEIDAGEAGDPVWGELVVKGGITLFSAREKIGKTTLCCMLIKEAGKEGGGELLGQAVKQARVLVVSEESTLTWQRRRQDEGLPDNLLVIASPSFMPDDLASWRETCDWVAELAVEYSIDLVVFDTWAAFAPVESENDNAHVHRAAQSFRRISEAGAAVLVFHHMAKGGGTRGGTALPAAVDTIIEMRKPKTTSDDGEEAEDDRIRIFDCRGRFDPPSHLVGAWNGYTYRLEVGKTAKHIKVSNRQDAIRETIHRCGAPVPLKGIREAWPKGEDGPQCPGDRTLRRDLKDLVRSGELMTAGGSGGANDPYWYAVPPALGLME